MLLIKKFKGLRPTKELAQKVASPPYDVLNRSEAFDQAKGNPFSFLRINKPEIDLDTSIDVHDKRVYEKGGENLTQFISDGVFLQDETETLYVYKQVMGNHEQYGLVAAASVEAYDNNLIKKHEFTRPEKEDDRVEHMDHLNAQVGPVFLTYKAVGKIDELIGQIVKAEAEYDFTADDDTRHTFWVIKEEQICQQLLVLFNELDCLYVADGHHRSAAASRIKAMRQKANPNHTGDEPYNYFLTVIFPDNQMQVLDYNRIAKDLNGLRSVEFVEKLEGEFVVSKSENNVPVKPESEHIFGMYIDKQWYKIKARAGSWNEADPVKRLDVSILQDNILSKLLGIDDPRRDVRVDFVGGIRGLGELESRVNSGDWEIAFSLFPTSIGSMMDIADAGEVMPPKSTWFEPKLKSGLIIHSLD